MARAGQSHTGWGYWGQGSPEVGMGIQPATHPLNGVSAWLPRVAEAHGPPTAFIWCTDSPTEGHDRASSTEKQSEAGFGGQTQVQQPALQ